MVSSKNVIDSILLHILINSNVNSIVLIVNFNIMYYDLINLIGKYMNCLYYTK